MSPDGVAPASQDAPAPCLEHLWVETAFNVTDAGTVAEVTCTRCGGQSVTGGDELTGRA